MSALLFFLSDLFSLAPAYSFIPNMSMVIKYGYNGLDTQVAVVTCNGNNHVGFINYTALEYSFYCESVNFSCYYENSAKQVYVFSS